MASYVTIDQIKELFNIFEQKFEQKLEEKLEPIRKELIGLKKNIGQLNDRLKNVEGYTKNDSRGIEDEISKNVKYFIYNKYNGSTIKKSNFKKLTNLETNEDITQFDGIYLMSFDDYQSINKKNKINKDTSLVIVEAKHYITIEQINEKIVQIYKIKKYIDTIKRFNNDDIYRYAFNDITSRKFENTIKHLGLNNLSGKIYLFIGGPTWEDGSIKYCKDINNGILKNIKWSKKNLLNNSEELEILEYLKNNIAVVIPSGLRYEIDDFTKQISIKNIIEEADLILPKEKTVDELKYERETIGGNKYIGLKMRILPNYINYIYT